jgi:hypothetical protein
MQIRLFFAYAILHRLSEFVNMMQFEKTKPSNAAVVAICTNLQFIEGLTAIDSFLEGNY